MKRIFFLGNSYLHRGPVPLLLFELAQRHEQGCLVYQSAPEAATLHDHLMSDEVEFIMRHGHWDVLVLQEHSTRLTQTLGEPEASCRDAKHLVSLFLKYNPQGSVCLLQTWARHPNHQRLGGQEGFYPKQMVSPAAMLTELQEGVHLLLSSLQREFSGLQVTIARAGDAWQEFSQRTGTLLHDSDGSHANPKGQWLTALTLYQTLFGEFAHEKLPEALREIITA
jgi:hypothetical protein